MSRRQALGQHFLISDSIAENIVGFAAIRKSDTVLEVGTGRGILLPHLCRRAGKVISVEKDFRLYEEARKKFSKVKNLVLEHGDAFGMAVSFDVFVSNLPYSESRNAIEWLVQRDFSHGVVMVQKEFAEKLLAREGKGRRAISVLAGYCLEMEKVMDVGKEKFAPPPKVDSTVIRLRHRRKVSRETLDSVNRMFSFKRKTVRGMARRLGLDIDSDKRLEDLADEEVLEIAKKVSR